MLDWFRTASQGLGTQLSVVVVVVVAVVAGHTVDS